MENYELHKHVDLTLKDLRKTIKDHLEQTSDKYETFAWETISKDIENALEELEHLFSAG